MHEPDDFVEFSARSRHEHSLRGFEWYDMLDDQEKLEAKDLLWAKYPDDQDILDVGLRGLFIGNFLNGIPTPMPVWFRMNMVGCLRNNPLSVLIASFPILTTAMRMVFMII